MSEDELYEIWEERLYSSGVGYEGAGYSQDAKFEMFNQWLEEQSE